MIGNDKQRIAITVSKEMADKLDFYCSKMGVNRSAMCAQFVGQAIMGYDKAFDLVDSMANRLVEDQIKKNNDDEQLAGQIDIDEVIQIAKK